MNNRIRISLTLLAMILFIGITISLVMAWYTSTSNDATFDSDEFLTVSQAYAGHFTGDDEYGSTSTIYENSEDVTTQVTVKPGEVIYYAFLFEVVDSSSIASKYQVDTLLTYGANSTTNYHGTTVGDYYSFLYNTGVEANSCHLFLMRRVYDETNGYGYSQYGDSYYTVNSTLVSRLSDSTDSNANVEFSLNIDMPTISDFPTNYGDDDKVYFMLYIPIWYQDIETNQNNEMDSYLKIASTVLIPISS